MGDMGWFSFFPSKNLGAFGDGGMTSPASRRLGRRLRAMRMHGMEAQYFHRFIGGNFRLDALQAAVLAVKLPHLDAWSAARHRNAAYYRNAFARAGLLGKSDGARRAVRGSWAGASPHLPPVRHPRARGRPRPPERPPHRPRDRLRDLLPACRCTSRNVSARSATSRGIFPPPRPPRANPWRCPSSPNSLPAEQDAVVAAISDFYA